MGYRLHAKIPNVDMVIEVNGETHNVKDDLELGKQYEDIWDGFNDYWFGEYHDGGLIHPKYLEDMYKQMILLNMKTKEYSLYNTDFLKEMIRVAIKNGYHICFCSY